MADPHAWLEDALCAHWPDEPWITGHAHPDLIDLCHACPVRIPCARRALTMAETSTGSDLLIGLWAGIHLPPQGEPRRRALAMLRQVAAP